MIYIKTYQKWISLIICILAMALTMGMITNCSGIFLKPICDSLQKSRADVAGIYSMYGIGQVAFALTAHQI